MLILEASEATYRNGARKQQKTKKKTALAPAARGHTRQFCRFLARLVSGYGLPVFPENVRGQPAISPLPRAPRNGRGFGRRWPRWHNPITIIAPLTIKGATDGLAAAPQVSDHVTGIGAPIAVFGQISPGQTIFRGQSVRPGMLFRPEFPRIAGHRAA
jgi:hypothetical protein